MIAGVVGMRGGTRLGKYLRRGEAPAKVGDTAFTDRGVWGVRPPGRESHERRSWR